MPDPYVIDPSEFTPAGSEPVVAPPTAKPGKAPYKIDPAAFKPAPESKYPKIADPKETLNSAVGALAPHSNTQAALMALGGVLPFSGEIAPLVEGLSPELATGLKFLGSKGLGPLLARIGTQTAAGAATAAATGEPVGPAALEGAEVGTGSEALPPLAAKIAGVPTAENAAAGAMRQSAVDTVSQKALENELGASKETAGSLAAPTDVVGEQGAQQLAGAKQGIGEARRGAIREVGEQFEPIYGPLGQQGVPQDVMGTTGQAARDQLQWGRERSVKLSPQGGKLLNELGTWNAEQPVVGVPSSSTVSQNIELPSDTGGVMHQPSGPAQTAAPTLGNTPSKIQMDAPGGPVDLQEEMKVGQLRGKLGQIVDVANSPSTSAMERRMLLEASTPITKHLQDIVPDEQKPLLQQIKNEYSQVNRLLPFKELKNLQAAKTLPELGDMFFSPKHAPATNMILKRLNPEQTNFMRQAWAASVLNEAKSPTEMLSMLRANKDAVKALYSDSKFGNIEQWRKSIIDQKKFEQGPSGLPAQTQFEEGLKESIKQSGLTPEALQAANDALHKSGGLAPGKMVPHGFGRYLLMTGPIMGIMGWGPYHHMPELIAPAATYYAGMLGWRAVADNPAALEMYRQFITSGWTKKGGDAFGRLLVNGINDDLRGAAPEHQVITPEMHEMPAVKGIHESTADHLAPTPSAAKRAGEVMKDLRKGKTPEVHADLQRGRLSLDEVNKSIQNTSSKSATALLEHVPLSEAMDHLEMASPEERQTLMPLVQQKIREQFKGQNFNRTLAANWAKRMQKIQAMA